MLERSTAMPTAAIKNRPIINTTRSVILPRWLFRVTNLFGRFDIAPPTRSVDDMTLRLCDNRRRSPGKCEKGNQRVSDIYLYAARWCIRTVEIADLHAHSSCIVEGKTGELANVGVDRATIGVTDFGGSTRLTS